MPRVDNSQDHEPVKTDVKDEKILEILSENSRAPLSEVAKKIAQSRDTTNYRVNRLKSTGIIEKFVPRINYLKLGFNIYHIFFLADEAKEYEKLIETLCKHDNTIFVLEYTDTWDIEVTMIAKNIRELDEIIAKIQSEFSETIIDRTELLEINTFRSVIFSNHFRTEIVQKDVFREIEQVEPFKADKYDIQILEHLCQDSRKSTYEIAKEVGLNADTIGLRIKKMLKEKLIIKFTITPNLSKLGYDWHTVMIKLKKFSYEDQKKFRNFVENQVGVVRSAKTFGENDIIIYISTKTQKEFHKIVKEIRKEFSTLIRAYDTLVVFKEHFYNKFPKVLKEI